MERVSKSRVAIIGGGPAGCMCAYFLQHNFDVTIFEKNSPLKTLLPTGGGRCNLAHYEFDIKNLAANYPRGEKFLYSVFSRFGTAETLEFFHNIGVETYVQDDMRIFPVSNSSKDVREKFLKAIKGAHFRKETVVKIEKSGFVQTDTVRERFDHIVIAIGGHAGFELCKTLGHTVIQPKKALVGLKTLEDFSSLAGLSVSIACEDLLFTHQGISGPYVYKLSSINARKNFPYKISIKLANIENFQEVLNTNPHKSIKNLLSEFIPKNLAVYILKKSGIAQDTKSHLINSKLRDLIIECVTNFEITVVGTANGGEVVTCGGVDIKEVNPKTMQSKLVKNVCFCGEVLDIDGFCGGFNLQNCWSTAFVAAQGILAEQP